MNRQRNKQIDTQTNGRVEGQQITLDSDGWMDRCVKWLGTEMARWKSGWTDRWIDRKTGGKTDR